MTIEVGVCLAAFADLPLADALVRVNQLGLSVIDLPTDSVFAVRPEAAFGSLSDPSSLAGLRSLLDRYEIRTACVSNSRDGQLMLGPHGPHTDRVLAADREDKQAHGRRLALEAVRLAGGLGAPMVRLYFGCPDFARWLRWSGSEVSWDDNIDAFVAEAEPLARAARDEGVILCLEPHPKQVAFDVQSVRSCIDALRGVGEDLGICFDAANVAAMHYDPVDFLTAMGVVPCCVHAKDIELSTSAIPPSGIGWVPYGPQPAVRFRSVPFGELDWTALLDALGDIGFDGPVFVEHEDLVSDRMEGIAAAAHHIRSLVAIGGSVSGSTQRPSPHDRVVAGAAPGTEAWW